MIHSKSIQRACVCAVAVVYLSGCAAPGQTGQTSQSGTAASDDCSTGMSAAIGGGLALLLNSALGDPRNNAKAAALGAAAGAGMCLFVKSQQVKTAEQVDADYIKRNGALSAEPKVVSYSTVAASPTVRRGEKFQVNSNFELANGSRTKVTDVKEELTLISPDGKPLQSGSKPVAVKSEQVKTAGAYTNSFNLTIPEGVPQGKYTVQTKLFVNGVEMARNAQATQMVWDGSSVTVLAAR